MIEQILKVLVDAGYTPSSAARRHTRTISWAGRGNFPRPNDGCGSLPFALNNVGSVQVWKQPRGKKNGGKVHSAKPDGFMDLVERASPGPYLEMFSRRARFGWDTYGDEALHGTEAVA